MPKPVPTSKMETERSWFKDEEEWEEREREVLRGYSGQKEQPIQGMEGCLKDRLKTTGNSILMGGRGKQVIKDKTYGERP